MTDKQTYISLSVLWALGSCTSDVSFPRAASYFNLLWASEFRTLNTHANEPREKCHDLKIVGQIRCPLRYPQNGGEPVTAKNRAVEILALMRSYEFPTVQPRDG